MHEGTRCTKERGARSSIHARTRESSTSTSTQTRTRTRRERVTTLDSTDHRCGDDAATDRDCDRDRGGVGGGREVGAWSLQQTPPARVEINQAKNRV